MKKLSAGRCLFSGPSRRSFPICRAVFFEFLAEGFGRFRGVRLPVWSCDCRIRLSCKGHILRERYRGLSLHRFFCRRKDGRVVCQTRNRSSDTEPCEGLSRFGRPGRFGSLPLDLPVPPRIPLCYWAKHSPSPLCMGVSPAIVNVFLSDCLTFPTYSPKDFGVSGEAIGSGVLPSKK